MKYFKDENGKCWAFDDYVVQVQINEIALKNNVTLTIDNIPINNDGTVKPNHQFLNLLSIDGNGNKYEFYLTTPDANGNYQPDTTKNAQYQIDQLNNSNWATIDGQITALKIGYDTLAKATFIAKFGYEISGYQSTDNNLYNVSATPIAQVTTTDHVYLGSKQSLSDIRQAATEMVDPTLDWYEDWGNFVTTKTELGEVSIRVYAEQQNIRTSVIGSVV